MQLPNLDGKVVLITGAGRGIGAAAAALMAEAGAQVIAAIKPGTRQESGAENTTVGNRLTILECDVRSNEDVHRLFDVVSNKHGRLDVLVNNAGLIEPIGHIQDVDADAWIECLAVNVGGAFRCTRTFLPLLLAAKGIIINISSGAAYRPLEGWSAYCSSKAALVMLSRAIAHEYGEQCLRVFSLGVPPTDTEMQNLIRASGLNPISKIPREKLLPAATTAFVLTWLCGPESRSIKELEIDVRDSLFTYLLQQQANA